MDFDFQHPASYSIGKEIVVARLRQIQKHGFGPEHDDRYRCGELPLAAATYTLVAARPQMRVQYRNTLWPWPDHWLRHESTRDSLIKAAAIIIAEIERIDRLPQAAEAPAMFLHITNIPEKGE